MKSHAIGHRHGGRFPSATSVVQLANHLSVVQTVVAAAKVTIVMMLLSVPSVVAPVAVALVTFAVYNANNLTDLEEDAVNKPMCAAFVERHRPEIVVICTLAIGTALVLAGLRGGLPGIAAIALPVVTGVVYSVPILPFAGVDRLKDVFAVNTVLVAGSWAVTVTLLPLAVADGSEPAIPALAVGAYLFLRTIISVEVFNVRDVAGDRASGVSTLPATLGLPTTVHVLWILDVAALAVVAAVAESLPPLTLGVLTALASVSMCLTSILDRIDNVRLLCLAKDAEYLAVALVALLVF